MTTTGISCRCGGDVSRCTRGCTLFSCCGGYIVEGHMSDCARPRGATVHGEFSQPGYAGHPEDLDGRLTRTSVLKAVDSAMKRLSQVRSVVRRHRVTGDDYSAREPELAERDALALAEAISPLAPMVADLLALLPAAGGEQQHCAYAFSGKTGAGVAWTEPCGAVRALHPHRGMDGGGHEFVPRNSLVPSIRASAAAFAEAAERAAAVGRWTRRRKAAGDAPR